MFALPGQDLGEGILNGSFVFDSEQAEISSQGAAVALGAIFGEMPGFSLETDAYRFEDTFEDAVKVISVPPDADVEPSQDETVGMGLGMLLGMLEQQAELAFGADWNQRAAARVSEWSSLPIKSFRFSVGRDRLMATETLDPGEQVSFLTLTCSNPLVDFARLKIIDGTWVVINRVRFAAPDMGKEKEFSALLGEVLGRNQGMWAVISVNQWVEEEY